MINTIIIDDEPYCSEILCRMLESEHPEIRIIAVCSNGIEGAASIKRLSPELVFLDVEMPKKNGFEMLEEFDTINFHLIFTTSYDQYAMKAIRFSALDYLLKPIDREELNLAIQKVNEKIQSPLPQQLELLMEKLRQPASRIDKVALPTIEGLQLIPVENIIYCESDDNYTRFFLKDKRKLLVTRSLKDVEEMLEHYPFIRVHRSYVINMNEIEKYIKGDGGYLVMSDGSNIDVARNKKEILLKKLLPYKGS